MFTADDLFTLAETAHSGVFADGGFAWDALKRIADYIDQTVRPGGGAAPGVRCFIGPRVQIGEGTVIEEGATILGPAIIGRNCQIRHNAYIRENVLVGDRCVVGNSTEVKNSLLFNAVQAPHFNYVGDSILGFKAHLGAGVILSNVRLDHANIWMQVDGEPMDTGLRKFGSLIGDEAEIGCNAVLNPGSVIGQGSMVYPNLCWRGVLPRHMIAKNPVEPQIGIRRPRQA